MSNSLIDLIINLGEKLEQNFEKNSNILEKISKHIKDKNQLLIEISTKIDYIKFQNSAQLEKLVKPGDLPNRGDKIQNFTRIVQQLSEDNKKTLEEIKKIVLS